MVFLALLTLLPLVVVTVQGQETRVPLNTVAIAGDTAKLYCKYFSNSCLQIRWQKRVSGGAANISDGDRVYDSRYRLENLSFCALVLDNVQLSDAGTFVCTITGITHGIADLIVLDAKPSCSTSCVTDSTAEKENMEFKCMLTYSGGGRPLMSWWNSLTKLELMVPQGREDGGSVSRDFSRIAVAPGVDPLFCLTRFYFDQTTERASNVPEVTCDTESCNIAYSVRNVTTWPLWFASPGEKITCWADGNPEPTFAWQWKEKDGDGEWEDVPDETSETIEASLKNETTTQLRCVAKNTVGGVEFSENSLEVTVAKYGAIIRTAIIVGIVIGVVILVAIAGAVNKFCFEG